jgi:hypothetical protein
MISKVKFDWSYRVITKLDWSYRVSTELDVIHVLSLSYFITPKRN